MEQMVRDRGEGGVGVLTLRLDALRSFVAASNVVAREIRRIAVRRGVEVEEIVLEPGFHSQDRRIVSDLLAEMSKKSPDADRIEDLVDQWEENFCAALERIKWKK